MRAYSLVRSGVGVVACAAALLTACGGGENAAEELGERDAKIFVAVAGFNRDSQLTNRVVQDSYGAPYVSQTCTIGRDRDGNVRIYVWSTGGSSPNVWTFGIAATLDRPGHMSVDAGYTNGAPNGDNSYARRFAIDGEGFTSFEDVECSVGSDGRLDWYAPSLTMLDQP